MPTAVDTARFRHEALLYSGERDFVRKVGSFVGDAVEASEPVLVVVSASKIERLRRELGARADHVLFADMAEVGANPARIIPTWREFVDDQSSRSTRRFRGVGEPISAERSAAQLVECQRHEALLNVAFDGLPEWWLVCPYDISSLDPDVIDEAYRTHPGVISNDSTAESSTYRDIGTTSPFTTPLPEARGDVDEFTVAADHLDHARGRVYERAARFGIDERRRADLVLAASEVATNSLRYGGGTAVARLWTEDETLYFEMRDSGRIDRALAGRVRPTPGQPNGYGLWLANQICDLVQIRTFESGTVVRLVMSRD